MGTIGRNPNQTPRWNDPVMLAHYYCDQTTHSTEQLTAVMLMGLGVLNHLLVYRAYR